MRRRFNRRVTMPLAVLFLYSSPAVAQKYAPPFPRDGATKVLEDEEFAIWDVTYEKGKSTGMHELTLDQVSVNITVDGLSAIKVTKPDGTWSIEQEKNGSVRFESKGTVEAEEGASDRPTHIFVFQLKNFAPPHRPITEGIPGQFENRVGAVKLFETDRIVVWDDTFLPGLRKPLHKHYSETAITYYQPGKVRQFIGGVPGPPNEYLVGAARIGKLNVGPHEEEQVEGTPRAIWVQYKYDF
jgi:hypothetical protein